MINNNEEVERKEKRKVEISEAGYKLLSGFLNKVNINGRTKIRTPDILEYAVHKLKDSDIECIQEKYYNTSDKIDLLVERHNAANPDKPITREQLLDQMLETHNERQRRLKVSQIPSQKAHNKP